MISLVWQNHGMTDLQVIITAVDYCQGQHTLASKCWQFHHVSSLSHTRASLLVLAWVWFWVFVVLILYWPWPFGTKDSVCECGDLKAPTHPLSPLLFSTLCCFECTLGEESVLFTTWIKSHCWTSAGIVTNEAEIRDSGATTAKWVRACAELPLGFLLLRGSAAGLRP